MTQFLPQRHKTTIIPQFQQHTPNFLFMKNNAPPHDTRTALDKLQEVGVSYMVWPAITSHLKPIELIWDPLNRDWMIGPHS
uniref:Tc1-like transposase DDE domain-containing protein n=1 Tax=Oryzias melastigma TaxID=30732 RepID=A0A3B3B5M1_ORYME